MILIASLVIVSFLTGSIPFGIIVARIKGIDLKKVGSGNIGATNVLRSMGKGPAVFTLLGDVLKGTLAVALGRHFGVGAWYEGIMGLSAILGHNFSVFLRFRGGKGVATSLGVLVIYSPPVALCTVIIWLAVALFTRYSSLGAIVSFGLLPFSEYLLDPDREKMIVIVLITVFILLRHKDNMIRLLKGTERRIGQRE